MSLSRESLESLHFALRYSVFSVVKFCRQYTANIEYTFITDIQTSFLNFQILLPAQAEFTTVEYQPCREMGREAE